MDTPRRAGRVLAACALSVAVTAGCGTAPDVAALTPAAGFDATAALAEFDAGDSAASVAGDEERLRLFETEPALLFSLAAGRNAAAQGRPQPGFRHSRPVFATPADPPGDCFFTVADLHVDGDELPRVSALHFTRSDGAGATGWKLSHNVVIGDTGAPPLITVTDPVARPVADLPAAGREELSTAVFDRSVGRPPSSPVVVPSELVDGRLAGALQIYEQQLAATGATVARSLTSAQWAPCTARTAVGSLAFLVLEIRDEVAAAPGATVTLAGQNPDMVGTGHPDGLTAPAITIDRVQVFLLALPDDPAAGAVVLGLNDAAVTATPAG